MSPEMIKKVMKWGRKEAKPEEFTLEKARLRRTSLTRQYPLWRNLVHGIYNFCWKHRMGGVCLIMTHFEYKVLPKVKSWLKKKLRKKS